MAEERDALICDLAETYHIYDYRSIPVKLLITLYSGLGPDSRIGMKQSGRYAPRSDIFLAMICDELNDIRWGLVSDGNNDEKPEHIAPLLYESIAAEDDIRTYEDGDSFDRARAEFIEGVI